MSEKTATERLRELLDERGVEWWKPVQMEGSEYTRWHDANGMEWTTSEIHVSRKLRIGASFITPEQAIDATLGRGTCHLINAADDLGVGTSSCMCFECGYTALDEWWDEFNFCPRCGRKVVDE